MHSQTPFNTFSRFLPLLPTLYPSEPLLQPQLFDLSDVQEVSSGKRKRNISREVMSETLLEDGLLDHLFLSVSGNPSRHEISRRREEEEV